MGAGRAGGQCVQSKQSLQLPKQAAHSRPGSWLPQLGDCRSSCSISPGAGLQHGDGLLRSHGVSPSPPAGRASWRVVSSSPLPRRLQRAWLSKLLH